MREERGGEPRRGLRALLLPRGSVSLILWVMAYRARAHVAAFMP